MRYPTSEKAEIIRLVEQSHLPAKRTLDKLRISVPRFTAGMINIVTVDLRSWLITVLDRIASENRIPDDVGPKSTRLARRRARAGRSVPALVRTKKLFDRRSLLAAIG